MSSDVPRNDSDVARILQEGLRPVAVPEVAGLCVSARYRAGGVGEVGGDWYDVLDVPDSGVTIVVGDVAGHGVTAATTMGHLRHALRAYALEDDSPGRILQRLNRLSNWVLPGEVASAIVAIVDPAIERMTIASAGHLPPLLVADDAASYLPVTSGSALGVDPSATYTEHVCALGDAAVLLFTDGVVERRGESIDDGLARFAAAAAAQPWNDDQLDRLVDEVPDPDGSDDLAVVAVRRDESR